MMKFYKYLFVLACILGFHSGALQAADGDMDSLFDDENNERDWYILQDYINTKRTIDVAEKSCNLTISGDVRTEWRHMSEHQLGQKLRGGGATNAWDYDTNQLIPQAGLPVSRNDFDVEFNLWIEYVANNAWAVAHLRYDNSAGVDGNQQDCRDRTTTFQQLIGYDEATGEGIYAPISSTKPGDPTGFRGSGSCSDVCVKAAYMGYNLIAEGDRRLDVEVGRRGQLYRVFDSQIQYLQRLDGILFTYNDSIDCFADWYCKAAGFVVDERVNQFAFVTELGLLNIKDTGIDLKYSFIDWRKNGLNRCFFRNPEGMKFLNSQWTAYYNFQPFWSWCKKGNIYGAIVWNADAAPVLLENPAGGDAIKGPKSNLGWYVGFEMGKVKLEGDWAFRTQYEWVQAHAVPDVDVSGIGRGNVLKESVTAPYTRGNTNYKGWRVEALYALTDNITFDIQYESSKALNETIGGEHSFRKFEFEAIYAF